MRAFLLELYEGLLIAFRAIGLHKLRSLLTTLGIIIGIVSVTAMMTVINGIEQQFESSMSSLGTDVLYIEKWPWTPVTDWWNYINRPDITEDLIEPIENRARYVRAVAPVIDTRRPAKYRGQLLAPVTIVGSTTNFTSINSIELESGRFYNQIDERGSRNVCVIGAGVVEGLFPAENPLGKSIRIGPHRFEVIGIMAKKGGGMGDDEMSTDKEIHIPFATFKKLYGTWRRSISIRAKVVSTEFMAEAEDELTGILRAARGLDALEKDDFVINKQDTLTQFLQPIKLAIYGIGIFLAGLSLLVGGIGVMNIMFVSVKERTKEIGIRKAVGAKRRTILTQFLIEAVAVCCMGGLIGILISLGVTALINMFFTAVLSTGTIALAFLICLCIGVGFGLAPAWTAAKAEPIAALRYE